MLFLFIDYTSPSEDGEVEEGKPEATVTHQPLRKADSHEELRQQFEGGKMAVAHQNKCKGFNIIKRKI